jgi:hypothetical protein
MMAKFLSPMKGTNIEPWYINFVDEYGVRLGDPDGYNTALAEWNGEIDSGVGFYWFVFENDADAAWFLLRFS